MFCWKCRLFVVLMKCMFLRTASQLSVTPAGTQADALNVLYCNKNSTRLEWFNRQKKHMPEKSLHKLLKLEYHAYRNQAKLNTIHLI